MPIAIPIAIAAASLISGFMKGKGKAKQAEEQRKAEIEKLTLQQKMGEDRRISRTGLGASILSKIGNGGHPGAAYGGRVNFDTNIDPGILAGLMKERTYDFSKTVGDPSKGAGWDFGGDMVGRAGSALGSAYGTGAIGGGGGAASGLVAGLSGAGGASGAVSSGMPMGTIPSTGYNFNEYIKPRATY